MTEKEIKKFIPGFTMGFVRSIISHPFEMLKLKTQMNINDNLFSPIVLAVLSNKYNTKIIANATGPCRKIYYKEYNDQFDFYTYQADFYTNVVDKARDMLHAGKKSNTKLRYCM